MEAETSQTQTESVEIYYKFMAWLHANQKRLLIGIGAVAVVAIVAGVMVWHKDQTADDADAKLFELPVAATSPSVQVIPPAPSAFLDLASQYPNTSAGEYALLLGAESLFVNGNYTEAQQQFSKYINDHPESSLVAEAKVGVAACLEAQGKNSDAIQKYQGVVSGYPNEMNVTEPAKLTLARLYEQDNRPDQALNFYAELAKSQNPYDPWASEARDRGELLLAKHPELRRSQAAASPSANALALPDAAPALPAPAPAPAPAPTTKPANQGLNLLNFPASSNATKKP